MPIETDLALTPAERAEPAPLPWVDQATGLLIEPKVVEVIGLDGKPVSVTTVGWSLDVADYFAMPKNEYGFLLGPLPVPRVPSDGRPILTKGDMEDAGMLP